jgi:pimeloyl-ACP methyl ester carboxylesterase
MPGLLIVFALLVLLALAGALYELSAESADRRRFPPPGKLVAIEGARRLHLVAQGERRPGQPLVVLESGLGQGSLAWRDLQPSIAGFARVISYDRAGLGWSDFSLRPHPPERMVSELHAALQAAGEEGPYVLAGHGMGATLARLFAARYPQETAALVLVDPAHEHLSRYLPAEAQSLARLARRARFASWLARCGLVRLAGQVRLRRSQAASEPAGSPPSTQVLLASQALTPYYLATLVAECDTFTRPASWEALPASHGDLLTILVVSQASHGSQDLRADLLARSTRSHLLPVDSASDLLNGQTQAVLAAIQTAVEVAALRPASPSAEETPAREK